MLKLRQNLKKWWLFYIGWIGFVLSDSIHQYTGVPKLLIGLVVLIIFCGWFVFQGLPLMRKIAKEKAKSKKSEDELK